MNRWAIDIDRDDIAQAAIVAEPEAPLPEGGLEVAIDLFALTANNVTYAALGKALRTVRQRHGLLGFLRRTGCPGPAARMGLRHRHAFGSPRHRDRRAILWLLAARQPRGAAARSCERRRLHRDHPAPHRVAGAYNQYQRLSALTDHDPADHDWWPVYRPLYLTGWLIADQMEDNGDYGAEQVVVAAASSKTALGFAHAMREREERPDLIALVSPASEQFVRDSKLYDRVIRYGEAIRIDEDMDTAFVDFAGKPRVTKLVHEHFGTSLHLSLIVGKGIGMRRAPKGSCRGRADRLLAPAQLQKRSKDWGGDGLRERIGAAWSGFMSIAKALTAIDRRRDRRPRWRRTKRRSRARPIRRRASSLRRDPRPYMRLMDTPPSANSALPVVKLDISEAR